jgi:hypothetical protein
MEILFLITFTLHNIEEVVWLPGWRKDTGKYFSRVSDKAFYITLAGITVIGYLIALLSLFFGRGIAGFKYVFLGLAVVMSINSVFPHLTLTIKHRKYAPGTLTGTLLNLPVGIIAVLKGLQG